MLLPSRVRRLQHARRAHPRVRLALSLGVLAAVSSGVVTHTVAGAPSFPPAAGASASVALASGSSGSTTDVDATVREAALRQAAAQQAAVQQAAVQQKAALAQRASAAAAARAAQRDPRAVARALVAGRGWSSAQFTCLDALWMKESGWRHTARNTSSGAYGIPQALPGGKMATQGDDWQTNPVTQIRWGLEYIDDSYGTPCAAWAHSKASNWY